MGDFVRYRHVYLDVRLLVVINTPSGVTIPFEVLSCDNVLSLKRMVTIETDIPVADQTLLSRPVGRGGFEGVRSNPPFGPQKILYTLL